MIVIAQTTNPVRQNFLVCLLRDAGIEAMVLDQFMAGAEGGIGAFPRRIAVTEGDVEHARRVLTEAGEATG